MALSNGWTSAEHVQEQWGEAISLLLGSEKPRERAVGAELVTKMRMADLKEREVQVKEREIAIKEQQAEDVRRLRILKQLAGIDAGELAKRAKSVGYVADGRAEQPSSVDGGEASQAAGYKDSST